MSAVGMLIFKDLVQQGRRLAINCLILAIFSVTAGLSASDSFFPFLTTMLAALCISNALSAVYEDEQGGLVFLRSLPLQPGQVIIGRYISTLLSVALLTITALVPVAVLRPVSMQLPEIGAALVAAAISGSLFVGFAYILFYRFGYRAVRSSFLFVFVGVMALMSVVTGLDRSGVLSGPPAWLELLVTNANDWVAASYVRTMLTSLSAALVVYAGFGWLATHFLRHRDL